MARLIHVTSPDPDTLLRAAAAPFCSAGPCAEPLPLLVVRQGGLRDAVHQCAADAGAVGWLGRPIVVFAELPALLAGDLAPLDDFERAALIRAAVRDARPAVLGDAAIRGTVLDALDRLFGDLVAGGVAAAEAAPHLAASALGDWESRRNADIIAIYERYLALIAALPAPGGVPRTDGRDGLLQAARAIATRPDAVQARLRRPLRPADARRAIDISGLADLRRGWRALLDALHAAPFVDELRVYTPDARNAPGAEQRDLVAWLREHRDERRLIDSSATRPAALAHLDRSLFALGARRRPASPELSITAAPDMTRELEQVARTIKGLLLARDTRTTRPTDIAVIARKARPYLTSAAEVLDRYGIPFTARLRHTLTEIPVIAALLRCLRRADADWTLEELRALAGSPYFTTSLDAGVLSFAAARLRPTGAREWITALDRLATEARDAGDDITGPKPTELAATADALRRLATQLARFAGGRTTSDWIALTLAAIGAESTHDADATFADGLLDLAINVRPALTDDSPALLRSAARLDATALRQTEELLLAWRAALAHDDDGARVMALDEWVPLLETTLAQREMTVRTGVAGGVQLLEALAAEGRSFDHVFVLGMSVGAFPTEPAPDVLMADEEKEALLAAGLPTDPARVWFAREAALWESLTRSARCSLALSYAYADANGAAQLGSAYLDEVVSCFDAATGATDWVTRIPGSQLVPASLDAIWSSAELDARAALALRGDDPLRDALLAFPLRDDRSAVDRLLTMAGIAKARATMREAADAPGVERATLAGPWNGRIADASLLDALRRDFGARTWSATQLESYGRCPFTFFARYVLGARPAVEVDDEDDARVAGAAMHAVLARVYTRLVAECGDGALHEDNMARAAEIVADECERELVPPDATGTRGVFLGRARELAAHLTRYVHWEMRQSGKTPRVPWRMEYGFGVAGDGAAAPVVELKSGGRTIRLRGMIDRVDRMLVPGAEDYLYVVDHKSGGSAFTGLTQLKQAGAVLQLALYLAAMRELEPDMRLWGGAYQLVHGLERKAPLDRCSSVRKGINELGNATQQKAEDAIAGAAALALTIVDAITDGRFPARVPEGVNCLSYCDFRDACREDRVKSW